MKRALQRPLRVDVGWADPKQVLFSSPIEVRCGEDSFAKQNRSVYVKVYHELEKLKEAVATIGHLFSSNYSTAEVDLRHLAHGIGQLSTPGYKRYKAEMLLSLRIFC